MSLSRKHFIELAKIINESENFIQRVGRVRIANRVAEYCQSENYNFDTDRFMEACGLNDCDGKHKNVNEIIDCQDCNNALDDM